MVINKKKIRKKVSDKSPKSMFGEIVERVVCVSLLEDLLQNSSHIHDFSMEFCIIILHAQ